MHSTLCLIQDSHGICLLHLTFRSEQRMQAIVSFGGGDPTMLGKDVGVFMVSETVLRAMENKTRRPSRMRTGWHG